MADTEKSAKILPIRTPSPEALGALDEIKRQRLEREEADAKAKRKRKRGAEPAAEPVTFADHAAALAEVVKAKAAEDRADAARTKLGKEHGQILKDRKAALGTAVEAIEGKSKLADELRSIFGSVTDTEEKAKSARARVRKLREEIAAQLDELGSDAPDWARKIKRAWAAVEAAKAEASAARGDAKKRYAAASERFAAVIEGARQLALPL